MPSFDVVSEVDMHELNNAIDQANREVGTRFDFKGIDAKFSLSENSDIVVAAEVDFQIQQMLEILRAKLVKRNVDIKSLQEGEIQTAGQKATMLVKVQQGIETELARKIVKMVKESKIKVQTAIQGHKLRVPGKNREDVHKTIDLLKEASLDIPLQFDNFRD